MTSQDVERRLTEVLHRRAGEAMDRTDTEEQLREFLARHDEEHPRAPRRTAVVGAALAAAAVAAAVFWGADLTSDRTEPVPAVEPQPRTVRVADGFVTAYAEGDVERAASFLAPDAEPWDTWRSDLARDVAWRAEYLVEPCQELWGNAFDTAVVCPFDLHVLGSEELGLGPFENGAFTVHVDGQGDVASAEALYNADNNGLEGHVEEVKAWLKRVFPFDYPLMKRDYEDLGPGQRVRWSRMWEQHFQKYIETH